MQIWQTPQSKNVNFVPREVPRTPVRVASVFADKTSSENALDDSDTIIDKKREVGSDGHTWQSVLLKSSRSVCEVKQSQVYCMVKSNAGD